MNKNISIIIGCGLVLFLASCNKDLNRLPANSVFADSVYRNVAGYQGALATVYAGYTLTGSQGPASSDIAGVDAGTSDFVRCLWNVQELSTDEAVCAWGDPGVPDFHNMSWTSSDPILIGLYARSLYQITLCNDFITHCTASAESGAKISGSDTVTIAEMRAEARFLRAFQYAVLMDAFANPPFATETTPVGPLSFPKQIQRADLFKYVESELLACATSLPAPRTNVYGRADQAAAWALLARIYLNAGVYTGTNRYTDAITWSSKVIGAGYTLMPHYANLFEGDNNVNNTEQILSIPYDGINTQTYGGTTFLVNSACANSTYTPGSPGYAMSTANYGVPSGGWAGNRSTASLPALFPTPDSTKDKRGIFLNEPGVTSAIANISQFNQGVPVNKFTNITSTGVEAEPQAGGTFVSTDFPLFRLAEQYLIYAEAVLQGGTGGDATTALGYINLLRQRAYGNASGNISAGQLTLPFILDERGRELYWECFRRTDLIRFNEFTGGTYLWPWKGGVASGTAVDAHYAIYPIPVTDLQANSNLTQNPGY
ncbi:RagB/SusD family nutrient uptake outer membrane protein [Puia dinghuensis]|uniref:Membrane protein n=1 Tax=Puia dinghuensis TaxID=1792502 RepID=A0A8J2UHY0_9BACT|nr:RagB/SusD family nutrient uptake outer membrane protein [Puia dinghuensis]GGB20466.1 membrane protein [Puia dinghuensis]